MKTIRPKQAKAHFTYFQKRDQIGKAKQLTAHKVLFYSDVFAGAAVVAS